jgi:hypothetical protein
MFLISLAFSSAGASTEIILKLLTFLKEHTSLPLPQNS